MNSIVALLFTTILCLQFNNTHETIRQIFYPGESKTFDFFHISPELKEYHLYKKYCVDSVCELSVIHNFAQQSPTTGPASFEVSSSGHEGSYTLSVKSADVGFIFPHILNISASYLCVQKPEDYLSRDLPAVYKRGRGVVVPCTVVGEPLPTVTWRRRVGEKFVDIVSDDDKYTISKLGHLFISNFSDSDVGSYSCSANNQCGRRCEQDSLCSKIVVQSPDYELKIEDEAPVNDTFSLRRVDYYFLNPANVQCWTGDCFSYSKMSSNVYMYIEPNSDINVEVFADMHSQSDYVRYEMNTLMKSPRFKSYSDKVCYGELLNYTNKDVMRNTVDCASYDRSDMLSIYMAKYNIAIKEPPRVTPITQLDMVTYGDNFTIDFKIRRGHNDDLHTSINVMEVACYKNGEEFEMEAGWHKQCSWNKTTSKVSLLIICATDTDTGFYQARVKNWAGSSISEPVFVETQPHSEDSRNCFSLRHLVLSSRSVRLEWDSPVTNLSKALIYKVVLENRAWREKLDPSHTVKLTTDVENLHPGTPYYAYVLSRGDLVGHRIEFRTHEERPGAPPTAVQCEGREGSTDIYCTWEEIPLKQRNGDITSYKVKYKLHYEWEFKDSSVEYLLIEDLEPVALYTVQIMGCTAVGCGSAKELTVTTHEDKPSYKPSIRYCIPGVNNIRVGWERPAGAFKHIFYLVNCKDKATGVSVFNKNVSEVDAVISGHAVQADTEYTVSITPQTSQGFGPVQTRDVSTKSISSALIPSLLFTLFCVLIASDFSLLQHY